MCSSASAIPLRPPIQYDVDPNIPDLQSIQMMVDTIKEAMQTSHSNAEPTILNCYWLIKDIEKQNGRVALKAREIFAEIFQNQNQSLDENTFKLMFDDGCEIILPNFFREILVQESSMFQILFMHTEENTLYIDGITSNEVQQVLEFIKTGKLDFDHSNIEDLIKFRRQCDHLGIPLALEKSEKLIVKFIQNLDKTNTPNFAKLLDIAKGINDLSNSSKILGLIAHYFIEYIIRDEQLDNPPQNLFAKMACLTSKKVFNSKQLEKLSEYFSKSKELEIRVSEASSELVSVISKKWLDLQRLCLHSEKGITSEGLRKISNTLTNLHIENSDELTDKDLPLLSHKLVSLTLNGSGKLTANGIQALVTRLTNLEKLFLDCCITVGDSLKLSERTFPKMQSLRIWSGLAIKYPTFIRQFPNLTFLSYVNVNNSSPLTGLPKVLNSLRFLNIFGQLELQGLETTLRRYPNLYGFAYHAANLRDQMMPGLLEAFPKIKIVSLAEASINDHELKLFVDKFPNLKYLKLKWCTTFTEAGLSAVLVDKPISLVLDLTGCSSLSKDFITQLRRRFKVICKDSGHSLVCSV